MRKALLLLALFSLPTFNIGCASDWVAKALTDPPNGGRQAVDADLTQRPADAPFSAVATVHAPGPPPITLAYRTREPSDGAPPRATVIAMHGWSGSFDTTALLRPLSQDLADAGCRVVLPDFRGHGDSTGDFIAFGHLEVGDLQALTTHLEQRGLLAGPLGVIGHSYGGGIVIQFAALDARPQRVLVLSPLADLRPLVYGAVRKLLRTTQPVRYHLALRWLLTRKAIANAQQKLETISGVDLATDNAVHRIRDLNVPVLVIQGGADTDTPPEQAQQLKAANPQHVELVVYPEVTHFSYYETRREDLRQQTTRWARALIENATPAGQPTPP